VSTLGRDSGGTRAWASVGAEQAVLEQLAGLDGDLESGFNAAEECLYRHPAGNLALVWRSGSQRLEVTFGELADAADRMAAELAARGVGPGSRVAVLLPRRPELLHTLFAIWRLGAAVVPLFTAFGPTAIATRVEAAGATVLVTDGVFATRLPEHFGLSVVDVDQPLRARAPAPPLRRHAPSQPFIVLFTSGTSGFPKGVPVPLRALLSFRAYLDYSVALRPDDRLWCVADPGWAYGLFCGLVGPMILGAAIRFLQDGFEPRRAAAFLVEERITAVMSAPTAYRLMLPWLSRSGLRLACSAGEPLPPELAHAFRRATGAPVFDQYGQTEVGMVAGNHHGLAHTVIDGSMGLAVPGYRVAVLDRAGHPVIGERGRLAVHLDDSPMGYFTGYLGSRPSVRDDACFTPDGWYLTGDLAVQAEAGHLSFASRSDDLIVSSGYRVGPAEIEEQLLRHPAVADCVVVGRPDRARGEVIVAFVVPAHLDEAEHLIGDLQAYVRRELAAHLAPREVRLIEEIPRSPSGKPQRFVLRRGLELQRR